MAKRGPKPNHYITPKGETVNGLSLRKKGGRMIFLPTGRNSPEFGTEDDPASAIHKFRVWQAKQRGDLCPPPEGSDVLTYIEDDFGTEQPTTQLHKEYWAAYFRDLILSKPKQAAIELDCEPLALLSNVANLKPITSVSLSELGECYQRDKEGEITPETLRNVKTWWNLFCDIVAVKNVGDLSHDIFKNYRAEIHRRQKKGGFAAEWVRNRFGAVKTTISHALAELDLSDSDRRNLDHAVLLKLPRKKKTPAVDITPEELSRILEKADEWESAIILTALNGAYLPKEIGQLRWDMIDREKKFLRFDREKSTRLTKDTQPVPRCCVLWDRTIEAIEKIKADSEHIFISKLGKPVHINTIIKRFGKLVEDAEIESKKIAGETIPVTFKHLRKSALTAASNAPNVPDRQVNLLAGHSAGIKDVYVVPRNVELACEAIESYYFPPAEEATQTDETEIEAETEEMN